MIVLLALAVPFWLLRASMRDPRQISGADKVIVRIATPVQSRRRHARPRALEPLGRLHLPRRREGGQHAALVAERAASRARAQARGARGREPPAPAPARSPHERRDEVVSAQVIGKNTNEFFRVARVSLDRDARDVGPNLPVISPDGVVGTTLEDRGGYGGRAARRRRGQQRRRRRSAHRRARLRPRHGRRDQVRSAASSTSSAPTRSRSAICSSRAASAGVSRRAFPSAR